MYISKIKWSRDVVVPFFFPLYQFMSIVFRDSIYIYHHYI